MKIHFLNWIKRHYLKILKSLVLIAIGLCISFQPLREITFDHEAARRVDKASIEYLDSSFKRALSAYVICRGFNAIVSFAQEMEIGMSGGAVLVEGQFNVKPFEVLDPLNDLVERFSWILLLSIISIGIQEFLIRFFSNSIVTFILLPGLLLWLIGIWTNPLNRFDFSVLGKKLIVLVMTLRLIIPAEVFISNWVYEQTLSSTYEESMATLDSTKQELNENGLIEDLTEKNLSQLQVNAQEKKGYWSGLKEISSKIVDGGKYFYDKAKATKKQISEFLEMMINKSSTIIENILNLIILFVINSVVLPIITIWLIVFIIRTTTNSQIGLKFEKKLNRQIMKS
jgi:hypothetical protein